ncbi:MAG: heme exporter protein CcmB [Polyangiaceae bacterium]
MRPSFAKSALLVATKDFKVELRTGEIVVTAGFFAVLVTVLCAVAFPSDSGAAAGAMWLPIAFSAVLSVGRTWQKEAQDGAFTALLVSPIPRAAIFLGKTLGVFTFLVAISLVVIPMVALFFHIDLLSLGPGIFLLSTVGIIGVAATGTLFGAMTVRTRAKDLVLASVLFPLLSPVLLTGVSATSHLVEERAGLSPLRDYFLLLVVFDTVALAAGAALFGALLED